jgi:hypothetical protein
MAILNCWNGRFWTPGWVRCEFRCKRAQPQRPPAKDGLWPGLAFPLVPGHEVAGVRLEGDIFVVNFRAGSGREIVFRA